MGRNNPKNLDKTPVSDVPAQPSGRAGTQSGNNWPQMHVHDGHIPLLFAGSPTVVVIEVTSAPSIFIAVGAILPGIGGAYSRMGYTEVLYMGEFVGLLLIWYGYAFCQRPVEVSGVALAKN